MMSDDGRPMSDERHPMSDDRRPSLGDDRRPMSDDRRPMSDDRRPRFTSCRRTHDLTTPTGYITGNDASIYQLDQYVCA